MADIVGRGGEERREEEIDDEDTLHDTPFDFLTTQPTQLIDQPGPIHDFIQVNNYASSFPPSSSSFSLLIIRTFLFAMHILPFLSHSYLLIGFEITYRL